MGHHDRAIVHDIELGFSSCSQARPVEFSPDGELIAFGVREDATELVRIAAVDGFKPLVDLDMDVKNSADLAFSPDSSMLATAAWNLQPTVWDMETGAALFSLDTGRDDVGSGNGYNPVTVMFDPDGDHVAVGYQGGTLELWRMPGAEPLVASERASCEPFPLPGDVLFDTGRSGLKPDADAVLSALAEQLEAGFTDAMTQPCPSSGTPTRGAMRWLTSSSRSNARSCCATGSWGGRAIRASMAGPSRWRVAVPAN